MADSSLTVTPGTGSGQNPTTQSNLQASGQASLSNGLTGKVQTGIAAEQLKSNQGISLKPVALSTVDLGATTSSTTATQNEPAKHHINPMLFGFPIVLFFVAIVMLYVTNQSGKKHNQYK